MQQKFYVGNIEKSRLFPAIVLSLRIGRNFVALKELPWLPEATHLLNPACQRPAKRV